MSPWLYSDPAVMAFKQYFPPRFANLVNPQHYRLLNSRISYERHRSHEYELLSNFFFNFSPLFTFERQRQTEHEQGEKQRERETQNPKQAPGSEVSAQSPTRGSNPRTVRSRSEPKSDAQPTEPPRSPNPHSSLKVTSSWAEVGRDRGRGQETWLHIVALTLTLTNQCDLGQSADLPQASAFSSVRWNHCHEDCRRN